MNRRAVKLFPLVVCLLLSSLFISELNGQVTFSRDWSPGSGKRLIEAGSPDFRSNNMKSANAICHILINHLRDIVSCDNDDPGSSSTLFNNGKL